VKDFATARLAREMADPSHPSRRFDQQAFQQKPQDVSS
jgi:hypothetical protein